MITVKEAKKILSEIPVNRRTNTLPIAKSVGMFCAKNIERIGDHSTNICEYVHFLIKGEDIKGDRPKG